jgi:hypothetical protein
VLQVNLKNSTNVSWPADKLIVDGSVASSLSPRGVTTYTGAAVALVAAEAGVQAEIIMIINPKDIITNIFFIIDLLLKIEVF